MSTTKVLRSSVNNLVFEVIKFPLDDLDNSARTCNCSRRADLLLMIFRFLCYICYNLFRGALWQYLMVLETVQRCNLKRSYHTRDELPEVSCGDADQDSEDEILDDEKEENMNDMCYDDSWIETDDYSLTDMEITHAYSSFVEDSGINSSSDTVDENVLFVTYLDSEDNSDYRDDDFNGVSQNISDIDPLELVLCQFEIDWDAPFCDQAHKKEIEEELFYEEEEFFIDDDCVDWEADEFDFWTEEYLHALPSNHTLEENSKAYSSAVESFISTPFTLEKKTNGLSLLDDDVLAAITGVPNSRTVNTKHN